MDPLETIKQAFDDSTLIDEQYEALVNIQDWFMCGGFAPKDIPADIMDKLLSLYRDKFEQDFNIRFIEGEIVNVRTN